MGDVLWWVRTRLRGLRRAPSHAVFVIAILGLGVGGVSVVLSVVRAVLLPRLPYGEPGSLTMIRPDPSDWQLFDRWREDCAAFEGLGAYSEQAFNISEPGKPARVLVGRVTERFLDVVRVRPLVGRGFLPGEYSPGSDAVAIITDRIWRQRFAASRDIIGRTLSLDDRAYTVVGVLPPEFRAPTDLASARSLVFEWGATILLPLTGSPWMRRADATDRFSRGVKVIGRLKDGITLDRARADLDVVTARSRVPAPFKSAYTLVPLSDVATGAALGPLAFLTVAVGLVLIVATANVANLVLARSLARVPEMSTRRVLGATRAHLVRDVLAENAVLGVGAGLLGIASAWVGNRMVVLFGGHVLSRLDGVTVDVRLVLFTLALATAAGVVAGVVPALRVSAVDPMKGIRGLRVWATTHRREISLRSLLVVVEVSLSFVLLTGAWLVARDFIRVVNYDVGFRPASVLVADIALSRSRFATTTATSRFFTELVRRTAELPGVQAVAIASTMPGGPAAQVATLQVESGEDASGSARRWIERPELCEVVAGDYFLTLSIPLRAGRAFNEGDAQSSEPVVVVNEAFARKYWGGIHAALNHQLRFDRLFTVVGVVGDVRRPEQSGLARPMAYFPYGQSLLPGFQATLLVRGRDLSSLPSAIAAVVRSLDARQPIYNVMPLDQVLAAPFARRRFVMTMTAIFGILALLVASAGVYGAMSRVVAERTHEIGVRLAVGGSPRSIFRLFLVRGMGLVALGVAGGLPLALGFSRVAAAQLVGAVGGDASTYAAVSVLVLLAGLASCAIPAFRAMRVDPIVRLRAE